MTKLEALKRLAAARTQGVWKHEPERYSAKNVIARTKDEPWIAHCQETNNGDANAEWIAAINNAADKLLAVVESAQKYFGKLDSELDHALAALEEG